MDKKIIHNYWRLFNIRSWVLLAVALTAGLTFVLAFRHNNVVSLELAAQVTEADKTNGENLTTQNTAALDSALKTLRQHIFSHMNAGLTTANGVQQPIQLKNTYDRLVANEKAKVSSVTSLTTEAQIYCEKTQPVGLFGANRLPCVRNYLDTHPLPVTKPINIPAGDYKFDFLAPRWSPDLAGWSLVVFIVSATTYTVSQISRYLLKRAIE